MPNVEGSSGPRQGTAPTATPKVSIGLPVYNGEAFLEPAIESILKQTLGDLELIISDNASTDATTEICQRFAERDERVRYFRQERNLGAAPNYNFTFYQAVGEFFKWSAHDDVIEPTMLERCVEVLEADPEIQLAFPRSLRMDEGGEVLGAYPDYSKMRLTSSQPSKRFGDMVCEMHNCVAFFGVMRRKELESTILHVAHEDGDRHLLAQLALRGPLVEVSEYLFKRRDHPGAYTRSVPRGQRIQWWDTSKSGKVTFPEWNSLRMYLRLIHGSGLDPRQKWACRMQLIRSLFGPRWYRQRWVKLLRDAAFGGYRLARRFLETRHR